MLRDFQVGILKPQRVYPHVLQEHPVDHPTADRSFVVLWHRSLVYVLFPRLSFYFIGGNHRAIRQYRVIIIYYADRGVYFASSIPQYEEGPGMIISTPYAAVHNYRISGCPDCLK